MLLAADVEAGSSGRAVGTVDGRLVSQATSGIVVAGFGAGVLRTSTTGSLGSSTRRSFRTSKMPGTCLTRASARRDRSAAGTEPQRLATLPRTLTPKTDKAARPGS